jgi:hypothetical protein
MDTYFKREPPKKPGNGTFPGESILEYHPSFLKLMYREKIIDHEKNLKRL